MFKTKVKTKCMDIKDTCDGIIDFLYCSYNLFQSICFLVFSLFCFMYLTKEQKHKPAYPLSEKQYYGSGNFTLKTICSGFVHNWTFIKHLRMAVTVTWTLIQILNHNYLWAPPLVTYIQMSGLLVRGPSCSSLLRCHANHTAVEEYKCLPFWDTDN